MKKTSPAYIIIFIILICLVFGIAVSAVHYLTLDQLQKNETLHRNRIICRAFDLPVSGSDVASYQSSVDQFIRTDTLDYQNRKMEIFRYAGPGAAKVGFTFSGMGFWERISGIIVLSPDLNTVQNIRFLEQKETPGLGARIEEQWFTNQFKGLEIDWNAPVGERVIVGGSVAPNAKNRVNAITGASQTSMALGNFLNAELEFFRKAFSNSPFQTASLPQKKKLF